MKFKVFCIFLLIIFIFWGCDLFPPGPDGADGQDGANGIAGVDGVDGNTGPVGAAGANGLDGDTGADAATVPGGTIAIYCDSGLPADSAVYVRFDNDSDVSNGGVIQASFPLAGYLSGGNMNNSFNWSVPGVPEGTYLVYAWISTDGSGTYPDNTALQDFFDFNGDYWYDSPNIRSNVLGDLAKPNYTITADFAADLAFAFSLSI